MKKCCWGRKHSSRSEDQSKVFFPFLFLCLPVTVLAFRLGRIKVCGSDRGKEGGRIRSWSFTLIWTVRAVGSSVKPSWCHANDGSPPFLWATRSSLPPHPALSSINITLQLWQDLKNYFIALARIQFAFFGYLCSLKKNRVKEKKNTSAQRNVCWICMFFGRWVTVFSPTLTYAQWKKAQLCLLFSTEVIKGFGALLEGTSEISVMKRQADV